MFHWKRERYIHRLYVKREKQTKKTVTISQNIIVWDIMDEILITKI